MSQIVTATFEDGMLKPDAPLDLPPRARVRLVVETLNELTEDSRKVWTELERLWDEASIDSQGERMTRDQLHERD
jgi:predicted DNA-binding antitoxin AbrB/MazE fold protein